MNAPAASTRGLVFVFAALVTILLVSAGASRILAGPLGLVVALSLAAAKATLIFTYFMRLRYQSGLVRIFALAGLFWLAILVVLVFADYLGRE